MIISQTWTSNRPGPSTKGDMDVKNKGVARAHKAQKHREAQDRQAAHDIEVTRVAHQQNVSVKEARRVVNARKRFEHKRIGVQK